jgi:hypothetical protein
MGVWSRQHRAALSQPSWRAWLYAWPPIASSRQPLRSAASFRRGRRRRKTGPAPAGLLRGPLPPLTYSQHRNLEPAQSAGELGGVLAARLAAQAGRLSGADVERSAHQEARRARQGADPVAPGAWEAGRGKKLGKGYCKGWGVGAGAGAAPGPGAEPRGGGGWEGESPWCSGTPRSSPSARASTTSVRAGRAPPPPPAGGAPGGGPRAAGSGREACEQLARGVKRDAQRGPLAGAARVATSDVPRVFFQPRPRREPRAQTLNLCAVTRSPKPCHFHGAATGGDITRAES